MEKLYKENKLYHCYLNANEYPEGRINVTEPEEYLQCAIININNGKKFDPHVHIECKRETNTTQEAWIVIKGKIKITYYDEECKPMGSAIISAGGCTMSFWGGHKYECLEDGTVVYEFKSGPYFGKDADKIVFND